MEPISLTLLIVLATLITYVIYFGIKINQYWKEKGLPYDKPHLFLGNNLRLFIGELYPSELHEVIYNKFPNEPLIGFYDFIKPTLLVCNVDYIEKICIKDFTHFTDHGFPLDEKRNPLDSTLFSMTGKRWKALRNKLSPIFTSGKLKMMFESMSICGNEMIKQIEKGKIEDLDILEIIGCFAMDTIGSSAFGIEIDNLSKPDNEFRRMGKKFLVLNKIEFIKFIILTQFPLLRKLFNVTFTKPDVVKYYSEIIKDTLKYRRENKFKRNDFIQLLMQLQDKGYVELQIKDSTDDYLNIDETNITEKFEMTDEQLTGHAVTFLGAGFEATTLSILYTLYELSKNQDVQEKAKNEIINAINEEGAITFDAVKKMIYLEQCVKESLRMYSPAPMLLRMCTKEYTFPNGFTIPAGQPILIPVKAIHYDPKYYPNPLKFNPDRFNEHNSIPSCAYLPFGNGPRICIGMRFALVEIKYCLAKLLINYNFKLSGKTKEPLTICKNRLVTSPEKPIYFNLTKNNV